MLDKKTIDRISIGIFLLICFISLIIILTPISSAISMDEIKNYQDISMNYAPLIEGKVPTINLGGVGADGTKYLRGDQIWSTVSAGAPTSASAVQISSDFYDASTNAIPGLLGVAISSGTVAAVGTTAAHPGVIAMKDSTTVAGGYKYGCTGAQLIAGGESFEVIFQTVSTSKSGTGRKMGWLDTAAGNTLPVDGIWFNISESSAGVMTLYGNTSSNNVRKGTLTAYTPASATWYRGIITINSAANLVTYTIYNEAGVSQWTDTVAASIPTGAGRDTAPCLIVAESTTAAGADLLRLDYVSWSILKVLTR